MKLVSSGQSVPCIDMLKTSTNLTFYMQDEAIPIEGAFQLEDDDGFVLLTGDSSEWLRCYVVGNTLVFTNMPEPEPIEPAEPPKPDRITLLEAQVAALSEQNNFQEELIVELATVVYA